MTHASPARRSSSWRSLPPAGGGASRSSPRRSPWRAAAPAIYGNTCNHLPPHTHAVHGVSSAPRGGARRAGRALLCGGPERCRHPHVVRHIAPRVGREQRAHHRDLADDGRHHQRGEARRVPEVGVGSGGEEALDHGTASAGGRRRSVGVEGHQRRPAAPRLGRERAARRVLLLLSPRRVLQPRLPVRVRVRVRVGIAVSLYVYIYVCVCIYRLEGTWR